MVMLSCTAVFVLSLLILGTSGLPFKETTSLGFTLGDDVTLSCPVTLCAGEGYKTVTWTFWSCDKYNFQNLCLDRFTWENGKISQLGSWWGTQLTVHVPNNGTGRTTLTVKKVTSIHSAYYDCHVTGTRGTDEERRLDVHLFTNSSAELKLSPEPIVADDDEGPMEFTCVDEAFVPGSFIRMFTLYRAFRPLYTELQTTCTIEYLPGNCSEAATCRATVDKRNLDNRASVHCYVTRPGGRRVETQKPVMIKKCTLV